MWEFPFLWACLLTFDGQGREVERELVVPNKKQNKTKHNSPRTEVWDFFFPRIKMQPVDKRMISSVIEEKNQGKNNRNNIRIL